MNDRGEVLWTHSGEHNSYTFTSKVFENPNGDLVFRETWDTTGNVHALAFVCLDSAGNLKWRQTYGNLRFSGFSQDIYRSSDGGFVFPVDESVSGQGVFKGAMKVDSLGAIVWKHNYYVGLPGSGSSPTRMVPGPGEDFFLTYSHRLSQGSQENYNLIRLNSFGNIIDSSSFHSGIDLLHTRSQYLELSDEIVYTGIYGASLWGFMKVDTLGNITANRVYPGPRWFYDVQERDSLIYLVGRKTDSACVQVLDWNGDKVWERVYPNYGESWLFDLEFLPGGNLLLSGQAEFPGGFRYGMLLKTDSLGGVFSSHISGKVYWDSLANCQQDVGETSLAGRLIYAQPGPFWAWTDSSGAYSMEVDTGNYMVEQIFNPQELWAPSCPGSPGQLSVQVDTFNYTFAGRDFANEALALCPQLFVDISSLVLRRCFPGEYRVNYCNLGTVEADSALVVVELDSFLTFTGSTVPHLLPQQGNTYTFPVGSIPVNDCGSFKISFIVDCDSTILGQSHCTRASIYPDSSCLPIDSTWDGSSLAVRVDCINGDSVRFKISNTSLVAMSGNTGYVVLEDNILRLQDSVQLGGLQDTVFSLAATGGTWGIFVEQTRGHPGRSNPSAAIEGCGRDSSGNFSIGYLSSWPHDDLNLHTSIDCQPNRGSYDPNDKQVFPEGPGVEHFVADDQRLEYLIRFQNTGTDTAFRVIVKDILPPQVDIRSLRMLNASHAYQIRYSGLNEIEWTFDNILLPDSGTDLMGSQGFLKFSIEQIPGNSEGTRIENEASIYFDFNAPIVTNRAYNTISEQSIWISVDIDEPAPEVKPLHIRAFPNPSQGRFHLQLGEGYYRDIRVEMYDLGGKLVGKQELSGGNQIGVSAEYLQAGIYFFRLSSQNQLLGSGKLLIKK